MKKLIGLSILLLLFISCKKNKANTIEGVLMEDCNMPAANIEGYIYEHDYSHALLSNDVWEYFTTDENGYFIVQTKENIKVKLNLKNNGDRVLSEIDIGKSDLNLGKVYYNKFPSRFIIKLDVMNSYTENDTLVLLDYNNQNPTSHNYKYYPGPFTNGVLDTVEYYFFNSYPIKFVDFDNYNAPEKTIGYRVRSLPNSNIHSFIKFHLAPICNNEYAEATLEIE